MTIQGSFGIAAVTSSAQKNRPCHDLVEQAENLALADIDESLHISALCRSLEVSERTLRKAFHMVRGLPPCRQLRMLRLSRARSALLSADCGLTTVTEIATCFGFVELGRFSVEYRKVFGESPSQTLCRASQTETFPAASGAASHHDSLGFGNVRTQSAIVPSIALSHHGNLRVTLAQQQEWK
jgi:AraC-like DNA-binding protein